MKKTILITGASSGIGKATAGYFNDKGWNVIASMRNPAAAGELTRLENGLVVRLDVLDPASIDAAITAGISRFGRIDVLVNNAGYGAYGPLESFPREKVIRQFNTNVIGLLDVTRAILPHFRKNKSGVVVNISSIGGKVTLPLGTLYHGTKFAVEGISEALAYEVEQFGGRIKIVEPGAIATDFNGRSLDISNDETMTEYQPLVGKIMQTMPEFFSNASPASVVAEVIYTAATDGSTRLRYSAGDDAREILASRRELDDETFIGGMKSRFSV